jgi:hypothetical protein
LSELDNLEGISSLLFGNYESSENFGNILIITLLFCLLLDFGQYKFMKTIKLELSISEFHQKKVCKVVKRELNERIHC